MLKREVSLWRLTVCSWQERRSVNDLTTKINSHPRLSETEDKSLSQILLFSSQSQTCFHSMRMTIYPSVYPSANLSSDYMLGTIFNRDTPQESCISISEVRSKKTRSKKSNVSWVSNFFFFATTSKVREKIEGNNRRLQSFHTHDSIIVSLTKWDDSLKVSLQCVTSTFVYFFSTSFARR